MDPFIGLVRRWALDWLSCANPDVCEEILAPSYRILIGGHVLDGRDAYVAGTMEQLNRFPGLGLTIHELTASPEGVAVRFTEHGSAARLDGRQAGWGGIALFHWDGERLTQCFAEEDYLARRRQLDSGRCAPIEPPAAAPWNTPVRPPDPGAEQAVRSWLEAGDMPRVGRDDSWTGERADVWFEESEFVLDEMFSAGPQVAFHGFQRGRYVGGLPGIEAPGPGVQAMHAAGIVTVGDGRVTGGRVVRDRLGLQRALARS